MQCCIDSLRRFLLPNYSILNVTSHTLNTESWASSTALLVIPGGADVPYARELNGRGNDEISRYVTGGGKFIGFCAGGYYASSRVEFELHNPDIGVSSTRELEFYPGIARGAAYKGYNREKPDNATTVQCAVNIDGFGRSNLTNKQLQVLRKPVHTYYHGGCLFVDAERYRDQGVQVLARYLDPVDQKGSDVSDTNLDAVHAASTIYREIGKGAVVLTGIHPEFSPEMFRRNFLNKSYAKIIATLEAHQEERTEFMKAILQKLGLRVNDVGLHESNLTRMALTAAQPSDLKQLVYALSQGAGFGGADGNEIKAGVDTFRLWTGEAQKPQPTPRLSLPKDSTNDLDFDRVIKDVDVYYDHYPSTKRTPSFNVQKYYDTLKKLHSAQPSSPYAARHFLLGTTLLYAETLTSTSALLFKNLRLLRDLPTGFAVLGACQLAAQNVESNNSHICASPLGVMAVSTVLRFPLHAEYDMQSALSYSCSSFQSSYSGPGSGPSPGPSPIIFVQYITAIALVQSIRQYAEKVLGYHDFPVFIKWPDEIYLVNPSSSFNAAAGPSSFGANVDDKDHSEKAKQAQNRKKFTKLGAIKVDTTIQDSEYVSVVGVNLNVDSQRPIGSLNSFLDERVKSSSSTSSTSRKEGTPSHCGHFEQETLLANFLSLYDHLLSEFLLNGFHPFQKAYHNLWLHSSNMVVSLEKHSCVKENDLRAVIRRISSRSGGLEVEQVDEHGRHGSGYGGSVSGIGEGKKYVFWPNRSVLDLVSGSLRKRF